MTTSMAFSVPCSGRNGPGSRPRHPAARCVQKRSAAHGTGRQFSAAARRRPCLARGPPCRARPAARGSFCRPRSAPLARRHGPIAGRRQFAGGIVDGKGREHRKTRCYPISNICADRPVRSSGRHGRAADFCATVVRRRRCLLFAALRLFLACFPGLEGEQEDDRIKVDLGSMQVGLG